MHRLLQRQLKRLYGKTFDIESLPEKERLFIENVSHAYEDYDKELKFIEHMLDVNSRELNKKNTDLMQTLSSLSEAQRLTKTGSWRQEISTGKTQWSDELYRILELDPDQVSPSIDIGLTFVHPDDQDLVRNYFTNRLDETDNHLIYRLKLKNGQIKHVHEHRQIQPGFDGKPAYLHGTVQDISSQVAADQKLKLYANVFHNSGQAILITDANKKIIAVNSSFIELTGYEFDDVKHRDPRLLSAGSSEDKVYEQLDQVLNKEGYWQGELKARRKDGHVYPKWLSISASYRDNGEIGNYICTFSDITDKKADEERIHYLAHYDSLTGLLNRSSLEERLAQAVHSARRNQLQLAVMFIDMDRFKIINDTFGHEGGDSLLRQIAKRLENSVRETDIVCRIGGDEFILVITELENKSSAIPIAHWLQHSLSQPYEIRGKQVHSSPSIGISFFPDDGQDCQKLMKNADSAMYHAKEQGRNNFQFFSDELNRLATKRLALEHDLRQSIGDCCLELLYQPKFNACDDKIIGVEALLRWNHPEKGVISPADFIPIAEESGLILPIGDWVINESCRQLSLWRAKGYKEFSVAINVSTRQLQNTDMLEVLKQAIEKFQLPAECIECEVTETAAMQDPEIAIQNLDALSLLGIRISIDDFGTGYSSLAYIKSLPINSLKLDRTFVQDIEIDENAAAICKATISLAHDLGLNIVAEGVETSKQRDFLKQNNCDIFQGYFYSRPVSAEKINQLLKKHGNSKGC